MRLRNLALALCVAATSAQGGPSGETERLVNAYRASIDYEPFETDNRLRDAAAFHNRWMMQRGCIGQQCPYEPDLFARIRAAGYDAFNAAQVVAIARTPAEAVYAWRQGELSRVAMEIWWLDQGCDWLTGPGGDAWVTCVFAVERYAPWPTPRPTPGGDNRLFLPLIRGQATRPR